MDKKNFRFFGIFFAILVVVLGMSFVLAALGAPTGLTFGQNTTNSYDKEGIFTVNWTTVTNADNYTIYIYADDVLYTSVGNDSVNGSSFNNTIDANYTFTIEAVNATEETNSTTNISMIVDTTVPLISYVDPTPTTNTGADRTWIFVNVTATDTNNDTLKFDLYYSNGTLVNSTGYSAYTTTNINWTGLVNNVGYIFNVTANDSATNSNTTATRTFYLDGTVPTSVTLTKSSSTRNSLIIDISVVDVLGITSSCTAVGSGTESISGTGTSQTLTVTGLSCGRTYSYTVTCSDRAGNSKASSATPFSTSACSSGGGGTTTTTPPKIHSWTKITPGVATIMKDFNKEIGIKQIQIEVNNEAQNVKVTVTKYDSKPAAVSVAKTGKLYRYLQVETQNLADNLDKATMTIQVEKSWVSDNTLTKENIALFKFDESADKWNQLATTFSEEDDTYYYYDVELTSFSYFAVGEKVIITEEGEEVGVSDERATGEERNLTWLWILIAVIVLAAVIGGGVAIKKRQQ